MIPGTYEHVHAGDVTLGHDGEVWGVEAITHGPQLAVTLFRHGRRVTGYPQSGTPVTVITPVDMTGEATAAQHLIAAGLGPVTIISERIEVGA